MAAAPPPYSPYDQKRQAREYLRAQRDAARAQRYYWRAMRRPSMAGPVVLLMVGIVALLLTLGKIDRFQFWDWYGQWWPLMLIAVGLVSLIEWFFDRDKPYGRRPIGGIVGLLILLAIVGLSARGVHHLRAFGDQFGDNDDFFSFMGEERDNNTQIDQTIPASSTIQVQSPRGDVTITPSNDARLHVRAHEIVHTNSDREAQRAFSALAPKVSGGGTSYVVRVDGRPNGRTDLIIELPADATVNVNATHGDTTISGLKNGGSVTSNRGDVKFSDMGAAVHAHMNHGDFSAHAVQGDVTVDGHTGDVTISEIKGSVAMDGEFFGDTHVENLGSNLHFHSSRTDIDVNKLPGDMTMDADDLHITQASGPLRIQTRSKNIDLSQISGDVQVDNSNGEVSVGMVAPVGTIRINNQNEPITLALPPNAGFAINATANDGDIETEFPLNVSGSNQRHTLTGSIGNGSAKIELTAGHGDVHVKKGDLAERPEIRERPEAPEHPEPPPAPRAPGQVRHLRPPKDAATEKPTVQ
jgi:DUF4097 and DUF4098 domain-containing protein YvlB